MKSTGKIAVYIAGGLAVLGGILLINSKASTPQPTSPSSPTSPTSPTGPTPLSPTPATWPISSPAETISGSFGTITAANTQYVLQGYLVPSSISPNLIFYGSTDGVNWKVLIRNGNPIPGYYNPWDVRSDQTISTLGATANSQFYLASYDTNNNVLYTGPLITAISATTVLLTG